MERRPLSRTDSPDRSDRQRSCAMGILDDLIQTFKEAVDEAQGRSRPPPTVAVDMGQLHPIDLIRQRMIAQRNAEAATEAEPPPPPRRLPPPAKPRPQPVALPATPPAPIHQIL